MISLCFLLCGREAASGPGLRRGSGLGKRRVALSAGPRGVLQRLAVGPGSARQRQGPGPGKGAGPGTVQAAKLRLQTPPRPPPALAAPARGHAGLGSQSPATGPPGTRLGRAQGWAKAAKVLAAQPNN